MAAKLLMDMTDADLMENYRRINGSTVHGTSSFADKFSRRAVERSGIAIERLTRQMLWLTVVVICTVISTVATIYGIMKN